MHLTRVDVSVEGQSSGDCSHRSVHSPHAHKERHCTGMGGWLALLQFIINAKVCGAICGLLFRNF